MTYGLNSNIKLFESLQDFDSYRDQFFNTNCSGIQDTVYIGPCEDHNNSIYEIRFVSGRNLTCIVRKGREVNMAGTEPENPEKGEEEFLCMLTDAMGRDTRQVWMTHEECTDHIRNSPTDYYCVDPPQSRIRDRGC